MVARASGVADPVGFGVDPVCRLAQEVSVTSDEVSLATDEAAVEMRRGRLVGALIPPLGMGKYQPPPLLSFYNRVT